MANQKYRAFSLCVLYICINSKIWSLTFSNLGLLSGIFFWPGKTLWTFRVSGFATPITSVFVIFTLLDVPLIMGSYASTERNCHCCWSSSCKLYRSARSWWGWYLDIPISQIAYTWVSYQYCSQDNGFCQKQYRLIVRSTTGPISAYLLRYLFIATWWDIVAVT